MKLYVIKYKEDQFVYIGVKAWLNMRSRFALTKSIVNATFFKSFEAASRVMNAAECYEKIYIGNNTIRICDCERDKFKIIEFSSK